MQLEKYYQAQDIRKNIVEAESLLVTISGSNEIMNPDLFKNLNIELRNLLSDKAADVTRKELSKIIKQLEKNFTDL